MPNQLPVTFVAAPLPVNWKGTPQQFLSAIAERLAIESEDELSFFVTGSVAPTSDVGPWLKDGQTWYVWDEVEGAYIPEILEDESVRYIVSENAPDEAKFTLWIETEADGEPKAVKTFYDGSWTDVYAAKFADYSTTAEMTTAIETAVDAATSNYPAAARMGSSQTVPIDTNEHKLEYDTTIADPDSAYDTTQFRYTAPVDGIYYVHAHAQADNDGGDASGMEIAIRVGKNGNTSQTSCYSGTSVANPPGSRWYPDLEGMIVLSAGDYLEVFVSANDGTNSGDLTFANGDWSVHLIKRT